MKIQRLFSDTLIMLIFNQTVPVQCEYLVRKGRRIVQGFFYRVIDVGSEWRTFSNEKGGEDRSRVGGAENSLLGTSDLSTIIGTANLGQRLLLD
jgi:hypothetical protein